MPTKIAAGSPLRMLVAAPQPFFRARETPLGMLHGLRGVCERKDRAERAGRPFGESDPGLRHQPRQQAGPGPQGRNRPPARRERDNVKGPLTRMLYTDLMLKMSDHLRMPPAQGPFAAGSSCCRERQDRRVLRDDPRKSEVEVRHSEVPASKNRGGMPAQAAGGQKKPGTFIPVGEGMPEGLRLFVRQPTNPFRFVDDAGSERRVLQSIIGIHVHGGSGHFDRLRMLTNLKVCLGILVRASNRHRKAFRPPSMPPLEKCRCQRQATDVDPSARALRKACRLCMENGSIPPLNVE
jgi:hypothetical protein